MTYLFGFDSMTPRVTWKAFAAPLASFPHIGHSTILKWLSSFRKRAELGVDRVQCSFAMFQHFLGMSF
jgi:hypothetical protein